MMSSSRGGGFVNEDSASQGVNSPVKSKMTLQSLRPVTIKQLVEAVLSPGGDSASIQSNGKMQELGQIVFVGCVRSLKESNTSADYVLEDGTGSILGKCWQDKASAPVMVGQWARVHGTLRTMRDSRSVNIFSVRAISDYNEVTLHFLQILALNIPPRSVRIIGEEFLNPLQKSVISVYSSSNTPQGLHYESVIRALSNRYSPNDIRDAISWLMAEGYIFETHDSDHAKVVTSI